MDPKNSFALVNLGRISRIINDLQRSEELLKQAIDLEPENLFAQLNYGELKIDQKEPYIEIKEVLECASFIAKLIIYQG